MKIQLELKCLYGTQRYYVMKKEQEIPLKYLTGNHTLTLGDIQALIALGIELEVAKVEGNLIETPYLLV